MAKEKGRDDSPKELHVHQAEMYRLRQKEDVQDQSGQDRFCFDPTRAHGVGHTEMWFPTYLEEMDPEARE